MVLKYIAGISILSLTIAAAHAAENGEYVQNSAGEAVKNSAGECVKAAYGSMPEGCGEATATPQIYRYVVPGPAPRHAPVTVVPKVKAKGNYKGSVWMDPASRAAMQKYQQ